MVILRMIRYLISINFKDFGYWFWTLCYPLLMCGLFTMTTSSMGGTEIEDIEVGIEPGHPVTEVLGTIDFIVLTELGESEAVDRMKAGEMAGYVHGSTELELLVTETGINQTILQSVLDQIRNVSASGIPFQNFDYDQEYIIPNSQNAEPETVLFYALISMISIYGMFSAIEFVSTVQPNLSLMGARFSASPYSKYKFLFSSVASSLLLNVLSNTVVLSAIAIFYQMSLFTELWSTLLLIFIANMTGIGLGLFIGLIPGINANIKTTFAVIFMITLSFLAGLMGPEIRTIIGENMPWLNTLNPLARMTDTMYRINFLGNYSDYLPTIGLLLAYALLLFGVTLLVLRRKQYDSI
ncbi:ABC transporter permease [Salinicoccus sp. ID82-1]|uniref:ABC transporter permease n=1 Tax=Salinicoccus cyprini TaxID=2493691 RepID=A0A558ASQ7_9STAP|nr:MULTISPECIES: ABC transporter permease [Salinicoccus]MCG1009843.1 ABC transporter permease [Salinicoccus sp. ID82-1]TVT27291.1 ABC transporter permease [Salinicoccus cyprini]